MVKRSKVISGGTTLTKSAFGRMATRLFMNHDTTGVPAPSFSFLDPPVPAAARPGVWWIRLVKVLRYQLDVAGGMANGLGANRTVVAPDRSTCYLWMLI